MTPAEDEFEKSNPEIARSAFRAPGIIDWLMSLEQIARDALDAHGGINSSSREDVVIAARGNIALTWALFAPYQDRAVDDLLHRVWAGRDTPRPGQTLIGAHADDARPGRSSTESGAAATSRMSPAAGMPPSRAPNLDALRASAARLAPAAISSILDTHRTELGKAVGDCSKAELEALSRRHRGYSKFYEALAAPMPPEGVVRDFHRSEEAAQLWRARLGEDADA